MKFKIIVISFLAFLPVLSHAGWETTCGDVSRVQAWASGSDRYGVKLLLEDNPDSCLGFWVGHAAENKELVYSLLLAALVSKNKICVQHHSDQPKQDGACRLNFVYMNSQ